MMGVSRIRLTSAKMSRYRGRESEEEKDLRTASPSTRAFLYLTTPHVACGEPLKAEQMKLRETSLSSNFLWFGVPL